MRRLYLLLLAFLTMLSVATIADVRDASAALCTHGQVMTARNACTGRPPLKFLPGNICGSGTRKPAVQQVPNANPNANVCQTGANALVSGCRCTSPDHIGRPRMVHPGGMCDLKPERGAACKEGMAIKKTGCRCLPPLKSVGRICIR